MKKALLIGMAATMTLGMSSMAQAEIKETMVGENSLYGIWNTAWEGGAEHVDLGKVMVVPGGVVLLESSQAFTYTEGEDGTCVLDLPEGSTGDLNLAEASFVMEEITEDDRANNSHFEFAYGNKKIVVTMASEDNGTDPLNPTAASYTCTLYKDKYQYVVLDTMLQGYEYTTDSGHSLTFGYNGELLLDGNDDGSSYFVYGEEEEYMAYVKLRWASATQTYYLADISLADGSITLKRAEDDAQLILSDQIALPDPAETEAATE